MNKQTQKILFSSNSDEWETPKLFFEYLESRFGKFTLDPASSKNNHKVKKYFTNQQDGLIQDWENHRVFVNPPYSNIKEWVMKSYYEGLKPNTTVYLLVPARTDTRYFADYCFKAEEIHFVKGRLKFEINGQPILDKHGRPQSAPFPSALIKFNGGSNINPICMSMDWRKHEKVGI